MELLNVLAEEVDGNGVLAVAAVPARQLGSGALPEVLLRRVVERVVLSVPPEIGDQMKMTTTMRAARGREGKRGD